MLNTDTCSYKFFIISQFLFAEFPQMFTLKLTLKPLSASPLLRSRQEPDPCDSAVRQCGRQHQAESQED